MALMSLILMLNKFYTVCDFQSKKNVLKTKVFNFVIPGHVVKKEVLFGKIFDSETFVIVCFLYG